MLEVPKINTHHPQAYHALMNRGVPKYEPDVFFGGILGDLFTRKSRNDYQVTAADGDFYVQVDPYSDWVEGYLLDYWA